MKEFHSIPYSVLRIIIIAIITLLFAGQYLVVGGLTSLTCHPTLQTLQTLQTLHYSPPILLRQLLHRHGLVSRGLLLDLVLVVLLADDLQVHPVLAAHVLLLLEEDGRVSGSRTSLEPA